MNIKKILLWLFLFISLLILGYGIYYYVSVQSEQTVRVSQVEKEFHKSKKKHTASSVPTQKEEKSKASAGIAILTFQNAPRKYHRKIAVNQGTDNPALENGAGWDCNTSKPNRSGNCVIYGHRDSAFAYLQAACIDDIIKCTTKADTISYKIVSIRITKPTANSINDLNENEILKEAILASNQIANVNDTTAPEAVQILKDAKILTLVTCHPFSFVGSSPNRCVVTAIAVK